MMYYGTRVRPVADVVAEALEAEDAASVNRYITFLMAHAFDTNDHLLRRKCNEIKQAHGWQPFQGPPASENNLPRDAKEAVPALLDTPRAHELWQKAVAQGWVDAEWQPLLSRPMAALLADRMAEVLGIATKWKAFEQLWRRKNMRNDYNTALTQQQCDDYMKKFKRIIS